MPKPVVAIIGRPNVGKSSLFNRLAKRRSAIVSSVAGTTRDRVITQVTWEDREFMLVDTGGLDTAPESDLLRDVRRQIALAIDAADLLVMVADVQEGVTPGDHEVAEALRKTGKPLLLAVNKADNPSRQQKALEFYELGLGDPIAVSAHHNLGTDDLMDGVLARLPAEAEAGEDRADLSMAIVGRTNVGKSMLLNAIAGEERAVVSDAPGTTRDTLDTLLTLEDGVVLRLVDTAGIRKRGSVEAGIERYSVLRSMRAIAEADVAAVTLDASELATAQDAHIAGYALEAFKGLVLVVNKWDLAGTLGLDQDAALAAVRERFKFAPYVPVVFTSALTGTGADDLVRAVRRVHGQWSKSVPRYELRRVFMEALAAHPPASWGRRGLRFYGVSQDGASPPAFTFYVSRPEMVHFSYRRYLENRLRAAYGFEGCPLRIRFKGRGNA